MTEQQIPKGYKLTEVGVIPEDWELIAVCDLVRNIIDYRGRTPKKLGMNWGGGNIVALSANNVKNGYIDFNAECYLASEDLYRRWMSNGDAHKNDLVFTMEAPLGNVALIPDDNKYILSQRTILLQIKKDRYEPSYIYQLFLSTSFQQYLQISATGSTAQGIKRSRFEKLLLIVPPTKKEQTAIANALSDTDALINQLKKLITKKQAIKTATMQQLLTGKTRLPEFAYRADGSLKGTKISELGAIPEDWEIIELGAISTFFKGKGLSKKDIQDFGEDKCIHYGQLFTTYAEKIENVISSVTKKNGSYIYSKFNDILMPTSDVTPNGLATASCIQINDVILGGDILIIRANIELLNGIFFSYLVKILEHKVMQLVTGITVYHLYGKDLANLAIYLPLLKEQTAIANILSEMDQEITLLETRLAKTEQIKQGMMQQLLTGKIRLI